MVSCFRFYDDDSLVQDCSNSIVNTLELMQSCTEPSKYSLDYHKRNVQADSLQSIRQYREYIAH